MPRERDIEEDGDEGFVATKDDKALDKEIASALSDADDDKSADHADASKAAALPADEVEEDQDARLAYDMDGEDGDAQERGESRRRRRNRARRQAQQQSSQQIDTLHQQVNHLRGVVDQMSRGQVGLAAGDLDGRIQGTQQQLEAIDDALARAVKEGDDATYRRAMVLRDEARDRLQQFGYARQRLIAEANDTRRPAASEPAPGGNRGPDPRAVKYSEIFMERHPWFDPADATDEDSAIVKSIDDVLSNEGYRPNTKMYWVELERRVKTRGIGEGRDEESDMDDDQEAPARRVTPRPGGLPPRSGRGGSRPAGSGTVSLTPFMRETLDAEGLLDEASLTKDQLAYRRRLVTTWTKNLKDSSSAGAR